MATSHTCTYSHANTHTHVHTHMPIHTDAHTHACIYLIVNLEFIYNSVVHIEVNARTLIWIYCGRVTAGHWDNPHLPENTIIPP